MQIYANHGVCILKNSVDLFFQELAALRIFLPCILLFHTLEAHLRDLIYIPMIGTRGIAFLFSKRKVGSENEHSDK